MNLSCAPQRLDPHDVSRMRTKGCCQFSDVLECLGRVIVLHVLDSLHFTAFEAESEPFVCTPAP